MLWLFSSTRFKKGEPITVFGDGQQTRAFTHVDDVVRTLPVFVDIP
jgi:nucleoside-diphosphate-sugar epimerase